LIVEEVLVAQFGSENVGHVTCLGRCVENGAFQVNGSNFSGSDIDKIKKSLTNQALLQTKIIKYVQL